MKVYYFDEVTGVLQGEGDSYSVPDDAFGFGEYHLNFENGGFTERGYI